MNLLRDLPTGALESLRAHGPFELLCVTGAVWVTQAGDATDHVLSRGERRAFPANAHTVLQALDPTQLQVRCLEDEAPAAA